MIRHFSVRSVFSVVNGFRISWALTAVLLLSSCGYRMSGTGALLPPEARTIAVLAFMNGTYEPGVDIELTRAVTNEFLADGRLKVVDREDADLVLNGTVTFYEAVPISFTAASYVRQYRVRLKVDANLEERKSGKVLWQDKRIDSSLVSTYEVTVGDIRATKITKEEAVQKASKDIAWTIRSRILEGF